MCRAKRGRSYNAWRKHEETGKKFDIAAIHSREAEVEKSKKAEEKQDEPKEK